MAISVACPSCMKEYNVKDDAAGKKFKCKNCGAVVQVPEAAGGGLDEDYGDTYDPYGGDDFGDGGASPPIPSRRSKGRSGRSKSSASQKTALPAIFIYIVSGLSMAYWIFNAGANLMGVEAPMFQNQPNPLPPGAQMIFGVAISAVLFFRDLFIVYAARKLQVCESYGIALTGAILCVIPCIGSPCCILGIPFGIWALVVLNNDDVKAAFS